MNALAARWQWLWVWPHFAAFVRLLHCTLPTPLALLSTETHFFWPPRWLVGCLAAWLLVKWLGPMQRWLIPRSSRVKVGRHSVSAQRKQTETETETEAEAKAEAEAEVKSKTLSRKQFLQTVRQFYSFRVEKENKQTELVRFDLLSTEARFERISAAPSEIYKSLALYTTHI